MPVQVVTQNPMRCDALQWTGENDEEIRALYPTGGPYTGDNAWIVEPQSDGSLKLGQNNSGGFVLIPENGWLLSMPYWVKDPQMQYWDRTWVTNEEYQQRFSAVE